MAENNTWPPPPTPQAPPPDLPRLRWHSGLVPLGLSLAGLICVLITTSAPSTRGLSGKAFIDAFEAQEELMGWQIAAYPLLLGGFLTGLVLSRRTWAGRTAVAVALGGAAWYAWYLLRSV